MTLLYCIKRCKKAHIHKKREIQSSKAAYFKQNLGIINAF
ncbi:Hypothetical protein BN2458_PEG1797 [Helicobacter typhlonius]|uniref:Uncharacterized protein n=1 Tax=Helicobacter typhlonius TaxID=76936 RepID=A0A0S4PWJ9_9HELI|nr:Hypothetical protein BN2458_PEG1797 [Helicobacter typhlonius]